MKAHDPIDTNAHSITVETPFYKWLETTKCTHFVSAIIWYLDMVLGLDSITPTTLRTYRIIFNAYWSNNYGHARKA
jgi:hypothetical protein